MLYGSVLEWVCQERKGWRKDHPQGFAARPLTLADVPNFRTREVAESTLGGETTCIVCFEGAKTHLAVPCGHVCACGPCAGQMRDCPYCRQSVQQWVAMRIV